MGIENHRKHSLGHRAFFIFFSRNLKVPIFLFLFTGALWYSERWIPFDYAPWGAYIVQLMFLVGIAYLVGVLALTYLSYRVYTYMFTDEAFIMTSGLAMRNEVAALYHQIQNVNINRSVLDRMIGVSEIVILMTGSDKDAGHTKIVLPAIGKTKAKVVQKELLVRARRHVPQWNA